MQLRCWKGSKAYGRAGSVIGSGKGIIGSGNGIADDDWRISIVTTPRDSRGPVEDVSRLGAGWIISTGAVASRGLPRKVSLGIGGIGGTISIEAVGLISRNGRWANNRKRLDPARRHGRGRA